jgi:prepilin-type N-terminal cleavage/methylation domain-containing protein
MSNQAAVSSTTAICNVLRSSNSPHCDTACGRIASTIHTMRARVLRLSHGFTLLELAITLAIVGVLAGAVLVPFVTQVAQRNIVATEKTLEQVKESLLGYATATGRLPCPASATSNGAEVFAVGGNIGNGNCASFVGFLPAVTLGFTPVDSQGYAVDGWGTAQNRIRYAVANQTVTGPSGAVTNPFTRTNGMRTASAAALAGTPLLFVCASGTASADPLVHCGPGAVGSGGSLVLTANAPIVVWSAGANAATGGTSVDEAQNNFTADRIFVSHPQTSLAGAEFDDIVTWVSTGNLVSRMVLGGQLP